MVLETKRFIVQNVWTDTNYIIMKQNLILFKKVYELMTVLVYLIFSLYLISVTVFILSLQQINKTILSLINCLFKINICSHQHNNT